MGLLRDEYRAVAGSAYRTMVRLVRTMYDPIGVLMADLSSEDLEKLRHLPEDRLIDPYFELGMYARNQFGLWHDQELAEDSFGKKNPSMQPMRP